MIAFLLAAAVTAAQPCTTVQPSPAFVCVNGGWLPPGHPNIPAPVGEPPVPPAPPIDQPAPRRAFWVGHRYTRGTTDVRIVGTGQLPEGVAVLFALCNEEGDGCFFKGMVRMFLANADSTGWTHHGPY